MTRPISRKGGTAQTFKGVVDRNVFDLLGICNSAALLVESAAYARDPEVRT